MSDWQVGDLAVCVDARANPDYAQSIPLTEGRVYTVVGVVSDSRYHALYGVSDGLALAGVPAFATGYYAEQRFRKIRPDEQEACEPEFVTLLKRIKRTVKA